MSRLLAVAACLALAAPARPAQPQFWNIEGARDFLEGDLEGLSVDSEGRLRVAPASRTISDPEAPYVWALARDGKTLYAGTGNEGKVFRIQEGKSAVFFDAAELEVHALAVGAGGRLYVATSPEGKVYVVERDGRARPHFDPEEKYIWALAVGAGGALYVATGAEGRVYEVDEKGAGQPLLTSPETHVTALLADGGSVYAGSSPGGIVYRIDAAGKVFVLHDSAYREVKALAVGKGGALYAAVIDGKAREERGTPDAMFTLPPVSTGDVTVSETITVAAPAPAPSPSPSPGLRPLEPARPSGPIKGGVLRIAASGEVDTLWSSGEETPYAMAVDQDGVLVGTGGDGRVYRVLDDRTWSMLASFPAEQVTAIDRAADGEVVLATSNPGSLHALTAGVGPRGTFTSKVKDTETVSAWGRLRWDARTPDGASIVLYSHSGNTSNPDSTWTDWSPPYTSSSGRNVASQSARFLQLKAVLVAEGAAAPVLDSVNAAYLQRNLRPQVVSITVHPAGEVFQKPLSLNPEGEILGLDGPAGEPRAGAPAAPSRSLPSATTYSRRLFHRGLQTFTWRADDPNGDTLSYDVLYRAAGESRFRALRRGLTEAVLTWDTATVPNGRYVLRVAASDAPSNPEALALNADRDSAPFEVDNTPPVVSAQFAGGRVRAVARDDSSIVRRAEYSVDGGRWKEVHPVDGINDALEETFEIALGELPGQGPHVVVVRASDLLGNVATARVEVP